MYPDLLSFVGLAALESGFMKPTDVPNIDPGWSLAKSLAKNFSVPQKHPAPKVAN